MKIELVLSVILLLILSMLMNPTHILMPMSVSMVLVVALIIGFLSFVGLVWQEVAHDEREALHMSRAGRWSFLAGGSIVVIGIAWQTLHHDIDPWLLYALSAMVLIKLIARWLQDRQN